MSHETPPSAHVLETGRLALRWLGHDDAGFIHELVNDSGWLQHIGDRGVRTVEDARNFIDGRIRAQYLRLGYGLNRVGLRATDTPIGICGLVKRDWLDDVDLGYAFLPRFRGQGFATEAAAATLEHARRVLGIERVAAIVSPGNRDSIRVLERLGMSFLRQASPPDGSGEDCLYARVMS